MEEDRDLTNVKGALIWVLQYLFLTSESLLIAHSNDPEKRVFDDILLRCVCQHLCEREPRKRVMEHGREVVECKHMLSKSG